MARILITGGAGFIGANLVAALHRKGHEITVLDNLSEQIHGAEPKKSPLYLSVCDKVRFIHGTVTERETLGAAMANQEVVVHYAAETGTGQSMYLVDHYTRVNIQATAMMLDILGRQKARSIKRIVLASSRSIYGEGKYLNADGEPVYPDHRQEADMTAGRFDLYDQTSNVPLIVTATDEKSKIHPSSVYGITKHVQEQLVMTVCPLLGIEPVALRYQNVYGPGQSLSNPYTGILSIFSNLLMQGKTIDVFEDGLESRDFVYIDDVVAATELAINHRSAPGNVFNVGSGVRTSVLAVVEQLASALGREPSYKITGNFRIGDIRHNFADLERISLCLGFKPRVTFAEGISRFARWAASEGPKNSAYELSIIEMKERGVMRGVDTPSQ